MTNLCRNRQATKKKLAFSANLRETAINVPQTLDTQMTTLLTSVANLTQRTEDNSDQSTGQEEATDLYRLGFRVDSFNLEFTRASAQHFAFLLSYLHGDTVSSVVADTNNEVYDHVITPMDGFLACNASNPSFTMGQVLSDIRKELIYSCFVKKVTRTYEKDSFVKIAADVTATGAHETNFQVDAITAFDDVVQLTLLALPIPGTTNEDRIRNIDYIRGKNASGSWIYVVAGGISAVSAATPAVIDFTNPGVGVSSTDTEWEVGFIKAHAALDSLPALYKESPLRTTNLEFIYQGNFVGGDIEGGIIVDGEITNVVVMDENEGMEVESVPGGTDDAANRCLRQGRNHEISFNRDFVDNVLQQGHQVGDIFAVKLVTIGTTPLVHAGSATVYPTITEIYPRVQLQQADINIEGKLLAENVIFKPLGDGTNGVVIITVRNKVASYAQ